MTDLVRLSITIRPTRQYLSHSVALPYDEEKVSVDMPGPASCRTFFQC